MTVTTIYGNNDGDADRSFITEPWATITAGNGTDARDGSDEYLQIWTGLTCDPSASNEFYSIYRGIITFDTSVLPEGSVISDAILSLYGEGDDCYITMSGTAPTIVITGGTPADPTTFVAADYQQRASTLLSDTADTLAAWIANEAYRPFVLNSAGIAYISLSGYTTFYTRTNWDQSGTFGGTWGPDVLEAYFAFKSTATAGTTNDPKLVITSISPRGGTPFNRTRFNRSPSPVVPVEKEVSDTLLVMINDQASIEIEVAVSDTLLVMITDTAAALNPIAASDAAVRRLHGKVRIVYSDPSMNEDSTVDASSGHSYGTSEAALFDGRVGSTYPYFTLDGTSPLDGTIALGDDEIGFWSDVAADATGSFSPAEYITIEFPTARTVPNFSISGDDQWDNYPVNFTVECYDSQNNIVKIDGSNSLIVTGNEVWNWTYEPTTPLLGVKKIKYSISKISLASAPMMITELYSSYYEDYVDADIMTMMVYEEMDFSDGSIPLGNISANECSIKLANDTRRFTLGNPVSPVASLMLKNRRIEIWFGIETPFGDDTVWKKRGIFWTQDWRVPEDALYVEILGYDRLELLRTSPFNSSQIYTNESIGYLMEVVLDDAGLVLDTDYKIDSSLYSITVPYGFFGSTTHKAALKKLAIAGLAQVYCDGEGVIRAAPWSPGSAVRVHFTRSKILRKDNPLAFSEIVNSVQVYANPRVVQAETEIFSDDEYLTVPAGDTAEMWCIFNTDDPCEDVQTATFTQSGANITLTNQINYTWAALLTFSNSGVTDQDVTSVSIDGKPVSIIGRKLITVEDADSISAYGKIGLSQPIDNPFIQDATLARSIADSLLAAYKDPRRDVEMDTWGYIDLDMGDRVDVVTYQDSEPKPFALAAQEFTYNRGVFRVRYKARRISE